MTTDYLLYENAHNIGPLNFKDKTLYEKIKVIDKLGKADRSFISGVIDAFLTKHQMWQVPNKKDKVIQQ